MVKMNSQVAQPVAAPIQQTALAAVKTPAVSAPAAQPQSDTVAFSGKLPSAGQIKTSIKALPALMKSAIGAVRTGVSKVGEHASKVIAVVKKAADFVVKHGVELYKSAKELAVKLIHKAPKTPVN